MNSSAKTKPQSSHVQRSKRSLKPVPELITPKPIWRRAWFLNTAIIVFFCVIALFAYWPILPGSSGRVPGCACGDALQSAWFLRWTPYAIFHGHNPFFTSYLNAPFGANLAQNTLMPLLGILTYPITFLAGPIASFNFLAWLAFPISAAAMFYVSLRLTHSRLASFAAGLLYGFSPYMVGQGGGHIMLSFVPLPPLMLLAVWQLLVEQKKSSIKIGIILALEIIAQFLIDPEQVAIVAIVIALALAVIFIAKRQLITRTRIRYALPGFATMLVITIAVLAYPIWFMVLGPNHFTGPNFGPGNPFRSDGLGLVIPTLNEQVVPHSLTSFSTRTAGGDYPETGDYIGIPLLLLIVVAVIRWRRNRWLVLSAVLALLSWILSLGPRLMINGHKTSILLPFAALTKLPLIQDILPGRLSLAEWLLVAILVALVITELQRGKFLSRANPRQFWLKITGIILVTTAIVISLIPGWPYPAAKVPLPKAFTPSNHITPSGTVALTYPYPVFPFDNAMLWQASSNMQFRLLGAYIQNPGAGGGESEIPPLLPPETIQEWLTHEYQPSVSPWPPQSSVTTADLKLFLGRYNVGLVLVDPAANNSAAVSMEFQNILGAPKATGNMLIWTNVQAHLTK